MPRGIAEVTLEVVWGPRPASLDDCAAAALDFLRRLGPFFSGLRNPRLVSTRKKLPVRMDNPGLKEVLQKGVNRTDVGREIIAELGYSIGIAAASSTDPGFEVDLDLNIGVTSSAVPNEVSLALGTFDPVPPEQVAALDWAGVFELFIDVWSPLYGALLTSDLHSRPRLRRALRIGWLTFLSASEFPDLPLPDRVPARPIGRLGRLIDCMPAHFPHHTKKDIAALNQVHRALAARYRDVNSL